MSFIGGERVTGTTNIVVYRKKLPLCYIWSLLCYIWSPSATYGPPLLHMVPLCYIWSPSATYGPPLLRMVPLCYIWSLSATYGSPSAIYTVEMACFLSFNVCKQNFDGKINCYVVNIGVYSAITIPQYINRCTVAYNAHCAKWHAKRFST